jgi:hypothetical protein
VKKLKKFIIIGMLAFLLELAFMVTNQVVIAAHPLEKKTNAEILCWDLTGEYVRDFYLW